MVIWKEFIQIFRDWRTLAVVIVLPVMMLVLYGYAINFDLKHLALGVLDQDRSEASRSLVRAFESGVYFDVRENLEGPGQVAPALDRGRVKMVLVIPSGFDRDLAAGRAAEVQVLVDGADSTSASTGIGYAQAIVQEFSIAVTLAAVRRMGVTDVDNFIPVEARTRFWYNPEQRSTSYIVPGLIAVIMMMMSSLLTAMTVVREKERGTIEGLIVSPLRPWELMLGKLIPYALIAFADLLLVVGAGRILFRVPLNGSPLLLLLMSAVFLMAALGVGLFISVASPTQQTAMTFAMLASQLPTVLLSGFIFPVSAMPEVVQWLTNIIPARHFLVVVRGIFLKGVGLEVFARQALILLGMGAFFLFVSSRKFKKKL
jgi:ABC-2 type transport system permease protein